MSIEETKINKFPLVPIVILAVIMSFFGPLWQILIQGFPYHYFNSLGESVCNMGLTSAPFLVILLAGPLSHIGPLRGKINARNLAYAYIVTLTVSYLINYPRYSTSISKYRVFQFNYMMKYSSIISRDAIGYKIRSSLPTSRRRGSPFNESSSCLVPVNVI